MRPKAAAPRPLRPRPVDRPAALRTGIAPLVGGVGLASGTVTTRTATTSPLRRHRLRSAGGTALVVSTLVALGSSLSGCGTSLLATTTSTASTSATAASQDSTTTTAPLNGEVAVAFPVVECTSSTGAPLESQGWKPSILLAPIPTALVGKVEFYSDGVHTVLGPVGWSCAQTRSPDGARGLVVYPANNPNPPVDGTPAPGTEGIFATFDDHREHGGNRPRVPVLHRAVLAAARGQLRPQQAGR